MKFLKNLITGLSLLFLIFSAGGMGTVLAEMGEDLSGWTICLDPGHGGIDPGAVNQTYNLLESEINLDVSYGLKFLFEEAGAQVVMTRTRDIYLENEDRYTYCNAAQADLLISVHTNSVTDPTWDGSMALYFNPDQEDELFAAQIYDVMYPALRETAPDPESFRSFGLVWFASGVLIKSDMPGVIVEPLFMSNAGEAVLLQQSIFAAGDYPTLLPACEAFSCRRGQIAEAVFSGVESYIDQYAQGVMSVADIEMSLSRKQRIKFVITEILVVDTQGIPLPGVTVKVDIIDPTGETQTIDSETDLNGIAEFKLRVEDSGTVEVWVVDLEKQGWVYDPALNLETSEILIIK